MVKEAGVEVGEGRVCMGLEQGLLWRFCKTEVWMVLIKTGT
jgi:hypothetical protein